MKRRKIIIVLVIAGLLFSMLLMTACSYLSRITGDELWYILGIIQYVLYVAFYLRLINERWS